MKIIEAGLKYSNNDICYSAMIVIGQFINALKSGKYDINKTAVLMTQTGEAEGIKLYSFN